MLLLESTCSGPYIVSLYMILRRYILVTYRAISSIKHIMGTRMKRPRTSLTLEAELDIIERLERGQTAMSLGHLYCVNESSVRTIRKSAEKIRSSIAHSFSPAAKKSLRVRNPLLEKMEMMLLTWMEDQKGKKVTVNTTAIHAKALKLYKELQQEDGGPSATEPFMASKG